MRIPNNNFSETLVSQLQRLSGNQARLQGQAATGQRITNPSDDPASVARVLQLQAEKQQIQQFARNNDRAHDISQSSFSAVQQLKRASDRAGELGVLGTGVTSQDAYNAYAAEADQALEQALQVANTRYSGEHLFGGTKSDAPPFTATRDATGKITAVTYGGAASGAEFRISEGAKLSPFTSGAENQQFADFLNHLVSLRDALQSGSGSAVQAVRPNLEASENNFLVTLSDIGAKQTRLEADSSQNEARFAELEKLTGAETDADLSQVLVRLTQAQTAYQAALQSGAQIMNLSLLDYVK
jgi:flagellar hook-associated protein 3 FlgL